MNIAVYCGSSFGNNESFSLAAQELGQWIGKNGHSLVYGGGESGLMGQVSKAAKENGACVTGVVPANVSFIANRPQPYCDQVIKANSMAERKQTMLQMSDAFVALPGGMGTLDEITEAITLTKIGVFNKKAVFFNKDGFYEPLKEMLLAMQKNGFMEAEDFKSFCFAENIEQLEYFLK